MVMDKTQWRATQPNSTRDNTVVLGKVQWHERSDGPASLTGREALSRGYNVNPESNVTSCPVT